MTPEERARISPEEAMEIGAYYRRVRRRMVLYCESQGLSAEARRHLRLGYDEAERKEV